VGPRFQAVFADMAHDVRDAVEGEFITGGTIRSQQCNNAKDNKKGRFHRMESFA
jgi:hypothetical protein